MIRIFMTGDNHIGLKYASHENAGILAESRINAFAGMVEEANSEKCDLFVITGDLFENTYSIPKKTFAAVVELLAGFHGTVAILPRQPRLLRQGREALAGFPEPHLRPGQHNAADRVPPV